MMQERQEEDHVLAINDATKVWVENNIFHGICSCGHHITGLTTEEVTRTWLKHHDEEMGLT